LINVLCVVVKTAPIKGQSLTWRTRCRINAELVFPDGSEWGSQVVSTLPFLGNAYTNNARYPRGATFTDD